MAENITPKKRVNRNKCNFATMTSICNKVSATCVTLHDGVQSKRKEMAFGASNPDEAKGPLLNLDA